MSVSDRWLGYAPAETTVTCGGETHRLRWERGELRSLDHDDAEGERTLAALGGRRNACIDLLDAWSRHADDLRLLTLASRGPGDRLAVDEPQPQPHTIAVGWTSFGPLGSRGVGVPAAPDDDLLALLRLGGGVRERLVATVAATWTERVERPADAVERARPQLHAALYGRATASLRAWLGEPALDVDLHLVGAGEPRTLVRDARGFHAELPFAWLVEVWARGLAVAFGRFCLTARAVDERRWTLTTVAPELGGPAPVIVELPG